jgi:hypothetical protein
MLMPRLQKFAAAVRAPSAPAPWPVEACLLVGELASLAVLKRYRSANPLVRLAATAGPALLLLRTRTAVESSEARRLGLTRATAPARSSTDVTMGLPAALFQGVVWLRGWKVREPPWPRALAQSIIREVDRRRSWNAAMRAGPGSG